jgi:hypothetical protein
VLLEVREDRILARGETHPGFFPFTPRKDSGQDGRSPVPKLSLEQKEFVLTLAG